MDFNLDNVKKFNDHIDEDGKFNDVSFIKDYRNWPSEPFCDIYVCCVKNTKTKETGVIFSDKLTTVFVGNVWDLNSGFEEEYKFDSIEQMVENGWVVD